MSIWFSYSTNVGYVWNVHDAFILREDHRILGSWIGCPSQAFQSSSATLPLLLMPEEIDCLIRSKANVRLIDADQCNLSSLTHEEKQLKHSEAVRTFESLRNESYQDQIKLYRNLRKTEVLGMVDKIVAGKRRKLQSKESNKRFKHCNSAKESSIAENVEIIELSSSDDNEAPKEKEDETNSSDVIPSTSTSEEDHVHRNYVISEELKKIKDIPPNLALVQTFYEHPWSNKDDYAKVPIEKWDYGKTSEKDKIRTATFRHLWKEGFYLTAGDKFGADFLAYPGDPVSFHASYVVICYVSEDCGAPKLSEKELVAKCRLGTSVKKTILLSYFENTSLNSDISENHVKFKRLTWNASNSNSDEIKPPPLPTNPDSGTSAANKECEVVERALQSNLSASCDTVCDNTLPRSVDTSSNDETVNLPNTSNISQDSGDLDNVLKDLGSSEFWKPFE